MPLNKQKVEVIKVHSERPICRPKRFPRMPIMYLELIENKEKIKQDLINKEYVPPPIGVNDTIENYKSEEQDNIPPKDQTLPESPTQKKQEYDNISDSENEAKTPEDAPQENYIREKDKKIESKRLDQTPRDYSDAESLSDSEKYSSDSEYEKSKSRSVSSYSDSEEEDDIISKKIKKLLHEERSKSRSVDSSKTITPNTSPPSKKRNNNEDSNETVNVNQPPTLSELKNKGQYVERATFRNIAAPTINEQEEEDLKRELLFKFELLKKSYKNANIPEFTIHSDYNTMLKSYNTCLKQVTLDNTVENYKQYLLGGFMLVEFVGTSFLKLDMTGFTQQQMVSMNSYERLLIELGEKSYVPEAKNWPVELRLLFMILMNAGIFIVTKMIMKKTGSNLMNLFGGGGIANHTAPPPPQRKRKMNGPDISVDELPDNK